VAESKNRHWTRPIVLMESGEILCYDSRFCTENRNDEGVGSIPYPDRATDPAVQVEVGYTYNVLILTQSGKVYVLGEPDYDIVQRGVNGIPAEGEATSWPFESQVKPVVGLPSDVVRIGCYFQSAIALTQSGQIWAWGKGIHLIGNYQIASGPDEAGPTPRQMTWSPPDGSTWLDAKHSSMQTVMYARTTTKKLWGFGDSGCTQQTGGAGKSAPHPIVLPDVNGAEDPVKDYWLAHEVSFVLGESNKLYSIGGTNPQTCGANAVSDPQRCTPSPDPVHVTSLEGKVPVQISGTSDPGPYVALMDDGEVYMWGKNSGGTACPGAYGANGGPTPRLIEGGVLGKVPPPACP